MLQVHGLQITMKKDLRVLVEGLSFSLRPGDKMAVVGEEGNGKSTLLKLIYDSALVEGYAQWEGHIQKDGMVLGYLGQELPEADKGKTVYELCAENDAFLAASPKELNALAAKLGLDPGAFYSDQLVGALSGGEKVKLRMALLALTRPGCYLLDEPSNDLDLQTLRWLEGFITGCQEPVLYISHDEALLEATANSVLHMEQLRRKTLPRHTVARVGYAPYVAERLHNFQKQEQLAKKERQEERKQQERFRQLYQKVEHQQNAISRQDPHGGRLLKKKMKAVKSLEKRYEREHDAMAQLPDTEEAILAGFGDNTRPLPGGKTVLDFSLPRLEVRGRVLAENLRLHLRGPEHVCIIGKNGAGKTTLLRQVAQALLGREDIKAAYMPQDYGELLDPALTPVEFLARTGEKEEHTKIKTYLGSMKYTPEEFSHPVGELSGGQRAKLFFLKMILDGANVLVLDEPTRNFSPLSGPVIRGILQGFPGAILSVSHDRRYIGQVCGRVLELTEGGLVEMPGFSAL